MATPNGLHWAGSRSLYLEMLQSPETSLCTYRFLLAYSFVEGQHQKKILPKEYVSNVMQTGTLAACINRWVAFNSALFIWYI